jgi:hypothetical protein
MPLCGIEDWFLKGIYRQSPYKDRGRHANLALLSLKGVAGGNKNTGTTHILLKGWPHISATLLSQVPQK